MAKDPQFHGHSKHISIKYHFVKEQVKVELQYCKKSEMAANFWTKGLNAEQFENFRLMAGMVPTVGTF